MNQPLQLLLITHITDSKWSDAGTSSSDGTSLVSRSVIQLFVLSRVVYTMHSTRRSHYIPLEVAVQVVATRSVVALEEVVPFQSVRPLAQYALLWSIDHLPGYW